MKAFLEHFKHFRRNMLYLKTHSLLTMGGTEQTVSEKTRILGSLCPTYFVSCREITQTLLLG